MSVHVIEYAVMIVFVKHKTAKCSLFDEKWIDGIGKLGNPTQMGKFGL